MAVEYGGIRAGVWRYQSRGMAVLEPGYGNIRAGVWLRTGVRGMGQGMGVLVRY